MFFISVDIFPNLFLFYDLGLYVMHIIKIDSAHCLIHIPLSLWLTCTVQLMQAGIMASFMNTVAKHRTHQFQHLVTSVTRSHITEFCTLSPSSSKINNI
jgi:hypothetical protein